MRMKKMMMMVMVVVVVINSRETKHGVVEVGINILKFTSAVEH